jgi:hypothetical protein
MVSKSYQERSDCQSLLSGAKRLSLCLYLSIHLSLTHSHITNTLTAWHDRFTDSLVNFETVKFFTAEGYEKERFGQAVSRFQSQSVNVQASLSFLNVSQQIILKACLATALSLAAWGIRQRSNCCVEVAGCESAISDCCQAVDNDVCPGMRVGDFVAVLTYTVSRRRPSAVLLQLTVVPKDSYGY